MAETEDARDSAMLALTIAPAVLNWGRNGKISEEDITDIIGKMNRLYDDLAFGNFASSDDPRDFFGDSETTEVLARAFAIAVPYMRIMERTALRYFPAAGMKA